MSPPSGESRKSSATATAPAGVELALPFDRLRVTIVAYHERGVEIAALEPGAPLVVGRSPARGLRVDHPTLSREHARFTLVRDRVLVEDLGSKNGVRSGGERVARAELSVGDDVLLGAVRVRAHVLGAGGDPLALLGEEPFRVEVEAERARAAQFGRPFALLLVRAVPRAAPDALPPDRPWLEVVRSRLRAVDRMALYGPDAAQVLLPETGVEESGRMARALAGPVPGNAVALVVGVAAYPGAGEAVDALVERSRQAAHRATREAPVALAPTSSWPLGTASDDGGIVAGAAMRDVLETVRRVAASRLSVVLHGETGTGKEVLARVLHEEGPRRGRRMVRVNCGAIPKDLLESTLFGHERGAFTGASQQQKGIFEEADLGTVFLDEIGELPLAAQAALLRVLESGAFCRVGSSREIAVDVRVIAATHRDLEAMAAAGAFRADLYYRLGGVVIEIPPLRARRDEVEPLAMRFLRMANEANARSVEGLDAEALAALAAYAWPGNVRELRNTVERAVVVARGATVGLVDLPARVRARPLGPDPGANASIEEASVDAPPPAGKAPGPVRDKVQGYEARVLREALEAADWNRNLAAQRLGMPVRTLAYRMKVLGVTKPETG